MSGRGAPIVTDTATGGMVRDLTPVESAGVTPRRWPDLGTLDLLVRVARSESIGKAAAEIGISQASASRRLDVLERDFGITLLMRTPRGSMLTPQGQVVVDWARATVRSTTELLTGVDALRQDRRGTLCVAASMTVAEYLVPSWLMALHSSASQANVSLTIANSVRVQELVTESAGRTSWPPKARRARRSPPSWECRRRRPSQWHRAATGVVVEQTTASLVTRRRLWSGTGRRGLFHR